MASLFDYLCEKNAVTHNPVKGVERPKTECGEGKTPALGDHQARDLLAAPGADTVKSKRDRAILSTLLFHALRREELCKLKVKDFRHARKGVPHLKVAGKGGKIRYLPLHPGTNGLINDYLDAAGQGLDETGALFRRHCQSNFYTACSRPRAGWSSTVFAHELPPRLAGFHAENRLYLFALTVPRQTYPPDRQEHRDRRLCRRRRER